MTVPRLLRSPALLSLVLGAVAACGFAPLEMVAAALLAIGAWMLLVHAAPTFRAALWRGWLFGLGHFTVNDNWFQHAFDFQDQMPPVLGYFAAVALALYLAVYPMMAAGIAWRFRGKRLDAGFVLVFAAAWIATEWLRGVMFTGYAWNPLGVMWVPVQPVAAVAAWLGTYALSGLTVAAAGGLLFFVRRTPSRLAALAAVLAAITVAPMFSYAPYPIAVAPDAARLVVVQPNIGQDARGEDDAEPVLRALERLTGGPASYPRIVFWPEGVVRDLLEDDYPWWVYRRATGFAVRRRLARLLGPRDLLLTGGTALRFDGREQLVGAANSVFAIDAGARIRGRYDKAHLVPYGEYLPMPWLLKPLGLARLVPGDLDFEPGPGPRSLDAPGIGRMGVQVCYEIIFSGEVAERGAARPRLLFNPSNDAWFGRWGPPQHLAQARMRAIEEGLPIVRATPTGISAVIGADGRLLATAPHMIAGRIETPLPPSASPTLFARAGNLMAALVAVILFAAGVALRRRHR